MEQVRLSQDFGGLEHRPAEQGKSLRVVVVIAQRSSVERVAIEEWRVVDEVELHSVAHAAVEHRAEAIAIIEWHRDAADHLAWVVEFR